MSKRPYSTFRHRPASIKVKQVKDPLLGAIERPIINNGKVQMVPQALAFAQVNYVVSMRVTDCEWVANDSVKVACMDCKQPCWRSPSSPKRFKVVCVRCCIARIKKENAN